MSKMTRPTIEPSVTCGFFNSVGDRKYDATQFNSLFDGLITDGIFATIGDKFVVHAGTGNKVIVGSGKAWFNRTWTLNDAPLPIECPEPEKMDGFDRCDAIVLEINLTDRDNYIKYVTGTPTSETTLPKPTLTKTEFVTQYPLCYIRRRGNSTSISESDITNCVGTSDTPFVTGILKTVSVNELLGQWQAQLDEFVASEQQDIEQWRIGEEQKVDNFIAEQETDFNAWYAEMKQLMSDVTTELVTWSDTEKASMLAWFDHMKGQLSTDAAANLQMQIDEDEIERILMHGFVCGTKTMSDDGSSTTAVDDDGRTLTKTFTDDFSVSTAVLTDKYGVVLGRLTKTFSADGSTVASQILFGSGTGSDEY